MYKENRRKKQHKDSFSRKTAYRLQISIQKTDIKKNIDNSTKRQT